MNSTQAGRAGFLSLTSASAYPHSFSRVSLSSVPCSLLDSLVSSSSISLAPSPCTPSLSETPPSLPSPPGVCPHLCPLSLCKPQLKPQAGHVCWVPNIPMIGTRALWGLLCLLYKGRARVGAWQLQLPGITPAPCHVPLLPTQDFYL